MALLDKTNSTATRKSVMRHALIGGVSLAILYPIFANWYPALRDHWLIFWPISVAGGAAFAALMEWQLDDGVEIYWIVREVESEFGIKIPEAEWMEFYTIADLFDATLAHLRTDQPGGFPDGPALEIQVWERLKTLLIQQLRLKPEQVVKSAGFYDELGL
jgi:hypothetical protein